MIIDEEDYISHYGTPRHSGRYPWGSGDNKVSTRSKRFLDITEELRSQGLSDAEIIKGMNITSTQYRARRTIANNELKQSEISFAQRLRDKGQSNTAIGQRIGRGESYVRTLLAPGASDRANILTNTAEMLKRQVAEKKFLDVGSGVETHLDVSKEKLGAALAILKEQGYSVHPVNTPQVGAPHDTQNKVLVEPGVTQRDAWLNRFNIRQVQEFSTDGGRTFSKVHDPIAIHPDRVAVKFKEDGGNEADGVIFVRPGVEDVSLGKARYAQVRIKVGDGHYLKGMAMYKDGLPAGTDLVFNTNKPRTANKLDVMKEIKTDTQLPFGSVVYQLVDHKGTDQERVTSVMNIVGGKEGAGQEGAWGGWSKSLSSQFLSKQPPSLAKAQLDLTYERRKREFDEINSFTNPTVKKKLLETFADSTDSAAVHLEAAALSRKQAWHVILPIESISPNEVYAPNYKNGEQVVLVRYPHGGVFEIPHLTVNNKNNEAKSLLGDAADAIGIHHTVAQRMSGADFDGDTVMVIPNNQGKVKSSHALEDLKNFDPIASYPGYDGMVGIGKTKQKEMGDVSNLITDMTIRGAPHSEIARAIRHSMVVIDADKHNLNYKQSAKDNGIPALKQEYQGKSTAGASTLISRAGGRAYVNDRKLRLHNQGGPIDPQGRRVFVETGKTRLNAKGERVPKTIRSTKLAETTNAHSLSSGTRIETIYADHSNRLKDLANQARLEAARTPRLKYSPSANKAYAPEVASLNTALRLAIMNRPRERQAQALANAQVKARKESNPNLDRETLKKLGYQALTEARHRVGAEQAVIKITQQEWNAIQAGAISDHKLTQILAKSDLEIVRKLATPRREHLLTPAKTSRARAMLDSGATRAEVATQLGVSVSTLDKTLSAQ